MTHEEVLDEINVVYERISHSEDFADGNYTEALEILIDFYETGLIEKLKKIKAEIQEEMEDYLMEVDYIMGVKDGLLFSAEIVDRNIKENKQ